MTQIFWRLFKSICFASFALCLSSCATAASKQIEAKSSFAIELVRLIPSLVWPILLVGLLVWKNREIARLFRALTRRVESGAAIKLSGVIEVGSGDSGRTSVHNLGSGSSEKDPSRERERNKIYKDNHGLMIAHTLHPSEIENQVYDILLYLVSQGGSFLEVKEVQYYFGKHWNHLVVTSRNRLNGFAVKVSAYGAFLCTARILFNDGSESPQYRFVDFEAPAQQPLKIRGED